MAMQYANKRDLPDHLSTKKVRNDKRVDLNILRTLDSLQQSFTAQYIRTTHSLSADCTATL